MPNGILENGKLILRRDADERKPLVQRLNRIEGQVRGMRQMIEADRYCADELQQIKAAIASLREVGMLLVEQHLAVAAEKIADGGEREAALDDITCVLREAVRL